MKFQVRKSGEFKLVYFELPEKADAEECARLIEIERESWNGPETVLFRGRGSNWLAMMLAHAAHATPNVATFDPRYNGYIVATSHSGKWRPGQVIPEQIVGMTISKDGKIVGGTSDGEGNLVIAVGGPPHSGKSVFLAELYRQLLSHMSGQVFLQRCCPDGEGMWSAESDPALVQAIRRKGAFTEDFIGWVEQSIQGLKRGFKITLLDLGGKRISPNDKILQNSTHVIVLSSSDEESKAWVEYAEGFGCKTLMVIRSRLFHRPNKTLDTDKRTPDQDWSGELPLHGELWQLDRNGPPELYREAVAQIAAQLERVAG